jgi:hypothetical protein
MVTNHINEHKENICIQLNRLSSYCTIQILLKAAHQTDRKRKSSAEPENFLH